MGYGNVAPKLQPDGRSRQGCAVIGMVISLEAFLGILYAGFSGAILFTKVLSIQSDAHVRFSEPICVEYKMGGRKVTCPVLMFKVVNKLGNIKGGEIVDAEIKCLVIRQEIKHRRKNEMVVSVVSTRLPQDSVLDARANTPAVSSVSNAMSRFSTIVGFTPSNGNNEADYDDDCRVTVIKRTFETVDVKTSSHPFFELDWVVTHTLDESSPLLRKYARKAIKENGGVWPDGLCNKKGIRESLESFNKLVRTNKHAHDHLFRSCISVFVIFHSLTAT